MMRLAACVCALGVLACASAGGGNAPEQAGVKDLGELKNAGVANSLRPINAAPDVGSQTTVGAPLDAAYHAILEGYGTIGVPIASDPRTHTVSSHVLSTSILGHPLSTYLNCGNDGITGQPRANSYHVIFSITSSLSAVDASSTRVTTLVTGEATDRATSATPVPCVSTGALERALLRAAGYQSS